VQDLDDGSKTKKTCLWFSFYKKEKAKPIFCQSAFGTVVWFNTRLEMEFV